MKHTPLRIGILGPGLMCRRRAPVLVADPEAELVCLAGQEPGQADGLAAEYGCASLPDGETLLARDDLDVVFVCTPPYAHAEQTLAALQAGRHVLCEKPLCRTMEEAEAMVAAAVDAGRVLKCGFNHRHHPALWEAHRRLLAGEFGTPMFARCRYGIIGREEYAEEWRADPAQAAGGQFIEQGTHAIDLFRWFLGELTEVSCMTSTHFFNDQPMEDGGMAMFRSADGATASLHTSLTQWKNLFSFEVFGTDGYLQVDGLGGGYGTEKLVTGRRDFSAPFQDTVTHFRGGDRSWKAEWEEMKSAIREERNPIGDGQDGLAAMRLALAAYEAEREQRVVSLA